MCVKKLKQIMKSTVQKLWRLKVKLSAAFVKKFSLLINKWKCRYFAYTVISGFLYLITLLMPEM